MMNLINKKLFFVVAVSLISVSINAQQRVVKSDDSRPVNQSEKRNDRQSELRVNTSSNSESRELFSAGDKENDKRSNIVVEDIGHGEQPSILRNPDQKNRREGEPKKEQ
jgi:hypothetical protein